jgi:hypothetical protein
VQANGETAGIFGVSYPPAGVTDVSGFKQSGGFFQGYRGVFGMTNASTSVPDAPQAGVYGFGGAGANAPGVVGESDGGFGVWGKSSADVGVFGSSTDGIGVNALSATGHGLTASTNRVVAFANTPAAEVAAAVHASAP